MKEPSYYAIIPSPVRYCEMLCPNAKLLYGELTALSEREGFCWASNGYFAELYKVNPTTISEWVRQLKDAGFIRIEQTHGETRKVFMTLLEKPKTPSGKAEDPPSGKPEGNSSTRKSTKRNDGDVAEDEAVAVAVPANIDTPEFHLAWSNWAEYRRQARIKKYTPIGAKAQLRVLSEMGPQRAVAAIQNSIANGYQGIFEPRTGGPRPMVSNPSSYKPRLAGH